MFTVLPNEPVVGSKCFRLLQARPLRLRGRVKGVGSARFVTLWNQQSCINVACSRTARSCSQSLIHAERKSSRTYIPISDDALSKNWLFAATEQLSSAMWCESDLVYIPLWFSEAVIIILVDSLLTQVLLVKVPCELILHVKSHNKVQLA